MLAWIARRRMSADADEDKSGNDKRVCRWMSATHTVVTTRLVRVVHGGDCWVLEQVALC